MTMWSWSPFSELTDSDPIPPICPFVQSRQLSSLPKSWTPNHDSFISSHLTMLQTNDCWNYEEQRRHRCGCCYDCAGFCRGFWGHRIQTIRGQKASTQVVIAHSPARYFAPSRSLGCRNSKTFEWLLRL